MYWYVNQVRRSRRDLSEDRSVNDVSHQYNAIYVENINIPNCRKMYGVILIYFKLTKHRYRIPSGYRFSDSINWVGRGDQARMVVVTRVSAVAFFTRYRSMAHVSDRIIQRNDMRREHLRSLRNSTKEAEEFQQNKRGNKSKK